MTPQIVIAGHVVKDVTPDGSWRPGGSALYAATQAVRLGLSTGVVAACEADIRPADLLPEAQWSVKTLQRGLVFDNRYVAGAREQRLSGAAEALTLENVPGAWREAPVALLAPVFHDVAEGLPAALRRRGCTLGLAAQGWLRRVEDGHVVQGTAEAAPRWLLGDVVIVSDEDVDDIETARRWQATVPVVVVTHGREGCSVWDPAGRHEVRVKAGQEVDPTGAGDVFAAAFLIRYNETHDALTAAGFAAAAAKLSVGAEGLEAVATREEIDALLRRQAVVGAG